MIKVVFDTVVFVRSLINPFSYWGKLIFRHHEKYRLFVSKPIIIEILEVLQRQELIKKFNSLQGMDIGKVIKIISEAEAVEAAFIKKISRDQKDDKFLITAHVAKVDYIISEDKDLLDLKEYKGIKIITTARFLEIISS